MKTVFLTPPEYVFTPLVCCTPTGLTTPPSAKVNSCFSPKHSVQPSRQEPRWTPESQWTQGEKVLEAKTLTGCFWGSMFNQAVGARQTAGQSYWKSGWDSHIITWKGPVTQKEIKKQCPVAVRGQRSEWEYAQRQQCTGPAERHLWTHLRNRVWKLEN